MGVVDFAAFDPVFWMHHTNCDRIFALWQALNPASYVVPTANQAGTFATKRGTIETLDSPLAPFWKAPGQFWTAAGVRDTRTLNYTYPELVNWANLDPQVKNNRIRSDINALYGRTAAWGAMNAGLFNVAPSVPATKPAVSTFGTLPTGGTAGTPRIPAVAAKVEASVPAAAGAPAQKPMRGPILDAATIRKTMEEGAAAARAGAAAASSSAGAASKKVAGSVPTPVASAVASAGNVASSAAAKIAAVTPAPIAAAANKTVGVVQASAAGLAASIPGQSSQAAGKGRESFEIDNTAMTATDSKHYNEWIANITVEKYAAKTTFFVYIFLGDFTADPAKWGEDPNLVGTHVVFANNMTFTGCERCRDQAEEHKLVTGTIPLTGALRDRLGKDKIGTLQPADIVPLLKKDLHWRIQTHDDKVIERTDMPSLKVSVARIPVALPESINEFPTWGSGTKESGVTAGRPGGANDDDENA